MKRGLVELQKINPNIREELVYATSKNFTGKPVYPPSSRLFLVKEAAERLNRVQLALEKKGLGLKVYDGYRPLSVQKIFWQFCPDPRYVADPAVGSLHNRGSAVDVTLVDLQGKELSMPSGYDDFSEKAHRTYSGCTQEEKKNCSILEEMMCKEGFIPYLLEWWHFDDPNWENYPILDISFDAL